MTLEELEREIQKLYSLGYSKEHKLEFFPPNAFGLTYEVREIKVVKKKETEEVTPIAFLE